jgi:hypothetical protein
MLDRVTLGLVPVFDRAVPRGRDTGESRLQSLDAVAERAAVRGTSSFSGWPELVVPPGFDGEPDDLNAVCGAPAWHRSEDVVKSIRAIRSHLHADDLPAGHTVDDVDVLLARLEDQLASAMTLDARVHFDVF